MSKPSSIEEAVRRYGNDILELDRFLFPNSWELSLYQIWVFRQLEKHRKRFIEACRGAGKSSLLARYFLIKMIQSLRWILCAGPTYRQSKHPYNYALQFLRSSPWLYDELRQRPISGSERSKILFKNDSTFTALPASYDKIHGERTTDLVVTEVFSIDKELYTGALKPMLTGGKIDGQRTLTFETSAGTQSSFGYNLRQQAIRRTLVGDPDWCFISIDYDDLKSEDFFAEDTIKDIEESREEDDLMFRRNYKNLWVSLTGAFYEYAILTNKALRTSEIRYQPREGYVYVAGGDVARGLKENNDDSAFVVWEVNPKARPDAEKTANLIYAERWHGLTADRLAEHWARLLKQFNVSLLVMDFLGGGVNVFDKLAERFSYVAVDDDRLGRKIIQPFIHTPAYINENHYALRGAFQMNTLGLPQQPEKDAFVRVFEEIETILIQLADLETIEKASEYLKFQPPSGRKDDLAQAALYGYSGVRQLLKVPEVKPREFGSPIVTSDLSRVIYGDSFAPF